MQTYSELEHWRTTHIEILINTKLKILFENINRYLLALLIRLQYVEIPFDMFAG